MTVLALLSFGIVMLCSTSSSYAADRFGNPYAIFQRQLIWLGVALVACIVATWIDYRYYRRFAWAILAVAVVLLVAVLVIGTVRNGARRWIVIGPVSFQPSEFAKLGLVIWLAYWLEKMHQKVKGKLWCQIRHPWCGFGLPLAVTAVMGVLILKEPDLGTTLLLFGVTVLMLWVAGSHPWWLGGFVAASAVGGFALLVAILKFGFLNQHYQVKRIVEWWYETDPQGINFQQIQALIAFACGGTTGVGLGESRQKRFYLPEAHTDFIFPIVGEEIGLIGSMLVVIAFCVIVVCGVILATRAPERFGLFLGTGIVAIIALQAAINIAVVTNTIPNKGMPLPFISYGGSNLMMLMAQIGVLLSISRRAHAQVAGKSLDTRRETEPEPESIAA
jgi:cell division protein FtsW